jgi:hypothetical protein
MKPQRFVATIIFSGERHPDVSGAEAALRMAGFEVARMPAKYRAHLCHPADDFFSVSKSYVGEHDAISDAMVATLNEIVDQHGAMADDCGPVDDDYVSPWWPS